MSAPFSISILGHKCPEAVASIPHGEGYSSILRTYTVQSSLAPRLHAHELVENQCCPATDRELVAFGVLARACQGGLGCRGAGKMAFVIVGFDSKFPAQHRQTNNLLHDDASCLHLCTGRSLEANKVQLGSHVIKRTESDESTIVRARTVGIVGFQELPTCR